MRIAHVTATFPPHYTGTGNVCYHNALGLAQRSHDVTIFTADYPQNGYVDPAQISVRRLPAPIRIGNAPLLPQLLSLDGFDVVHLHYPFYFGAELVFLRSLRNNLRYIVTYHQDVVFAGPLRYVESLHHRLLGQRILAQADRVLATSMDYARVSRLGHFVRTQPEIVRELPNGVDAERFRPGVNAGNLGARYHITDTDAVILFVGALDKAHYFKGVDVLLRALSCLAGENVKLLMVGDGDLRATYERRAVRLGLADQVVFCGRVSDEELPAHYALCDVLALPSTTMGEAFGVVLLEAMASGKPAIASNLPGVRSVVDDGEDGLLAEPGNAEDLAVEIQALLNDPRRRREMGERGRAKVEAKYAWSVIIPQLEAVYAKIVG